MIINKKKIVHISLDDRTITIHLKQISNYINSHDIEINNEIEIENVLINTTRYLNKSEQFFVLDDLKTELNRKYNK